MKTHLLTLIGFAFITISVKTQTNIQSSTIDSLKDFDRSYWTNQYHQLHSNPLHLNEFILSHERDFINETFFTSNTNHSNLSAAPNTPQAACTNVDFESGNLNGWVTSNGYHPLYNATGCCLNAGGAQIVTSGAGNDPCAGFPVVSPGGNFSLRLGNNGVNGRADRLEQTFNVTLANANFTYRYAVVFQDPGHVAAEQPSFQIEMVDATGNQIPCTFYNVSAGQNIPGFLNSTTCASVVYKPWTNVSVDLTNYIGQNVTIRFTTYDCSLGGHYGYAYIDGSCTELQQAFHDTICVGQNINICAPNGYGSYNWTNGGLGGNTSQCVTITNPGNYLVNTTQVTGCPGPAFQFNVQNFPTPNANFNIGNSNINCGMTVNFNNTSSMSAGVITSYNWNFGDGNSSSLENPSHTYINSGTYTVSLIVGSPRDCFDTTQRVITVNPQPTSSFIFNNSCQYSNVQFTDQTNIQQGNINQWFWNFGNGITSTLQNPTVAYLNPGIYTVSLNATSNQGCVAVSNNTIMINPKPVAGFTFSQANMCDSVIPFSNTSSISDNSSLSYLWNFGSVNASSSNSNPSYGFSGAGTYTVSLTSNSIYNCSDTIVHTVSIHPYPIADFLSNNVCLNNQSNFSNLSTIAQGSIMSNIWNLGNGMQSALQNPSVIYANPGDYTVSLTLSSNMNCTSSISKVVSVFALPIINVSSNMVCLGQATIFNNNSTVLSGQITNYIWDFYNDGISDATAIHPSFVSNTEGTIPVRITAISDNNCVSTSTVSIRVYPVPIPQFASQPVCQGSPVIFNNQTYLSSGQIVNYHWNFGNGNSANINSPQHLYATHGTYQVTLTATSNFNCTASVVNPVVVYPKPNVNFSSTTVCYNQATQFVNLSNIPNGLIARYKWDFDNNGIIDDTTANPTFIYPSAGNKVSKLIVISDLNCNSQTINTVVVHFNPIANFHVPSTCLPSATQFNNLSISNDGQLIAYSWDFDGDNMIDNVSENPQYIFTQFGNYGVKLEVQTEFGCVNSIMKSAFVNPTPSVLFSASNKEGCPKLCVNFQNSSYIESGNITTYQWIFGDNSLPNYDINPMHCYGTGNYNVTLKVVSDSGCVASFTQNNLVNVFPEPIAGFSINPEEVDITAPLIEVTDNSIGASMVNYLFNDGTTKNTRNFEHMFHTNVAKTVAILQVVKNEYGCVDSMIKKVVIKPDYVLYIPNAFTPNSDGINDGFKAVGIGVVEFKLQIFDRWGALIFESNDINKAWDGSVNGKGDSESTKQEVYVWKAEVKDVRNENHYLIGHVTLLK
jgi:gliding motility-associated-like protein